MFKKTKLAPIFTKNDVVDNNNPSYKTKISNI